MKIDLSQFRENFLQESSEHILAIESGLLRIRSGDSDDETLHSVFRAAHSIKGGAGAFDLGEVVKFTHVLENLFDQMREHKVQTTPELIALLLRANDVLKVMLDSTDEASLDEAAEVQRSLEKAAGSLIIPGGKQLQEPSAPSAAPELVDPSVREREYLVLFRPSQGLFSVGSDPLLLLRNLSALGDVTAVRLDARELPGLALLCATTCYLAWEIELLSSVSHSDIEEVFEFVLDNATVSISEKTSVAKAEAAVSPQPGKRPEGAAKSPAGRGESASVRVPTEKIDKLIDLVGEMVIANSITARLAANISPELGTELQESVANLDRHIRELHERTMSVRMLPLGSLFSRFNRLIHDLAEKTGKQLRLITEGEETEVDRGIIELLGDPLTHVLRNSADHGIETPAVRASAGKNPEGTILLRASQQAGSILIEVIDDGAGLNLERIRQKAVSKNLIAADAVLTEEELRLLILEPGFSTKEEVSDLSGRGVGMDVVNKNVAALNGSISLDSVSNVGTHIKIKLPLTLAIMEGLMVRVETHTFVVPLTAIVETVCVEDSQVLSIAGQGEVALVRDEAIPFLRLRRMFGLSLESSADVTQLENRKLIVVIEHGRQSAALEIDELLGQQQIVVKSLERNFAKLDGTLGATILGDGKAALILDVQALMMRRSKVPGMRAGKPRMSLVA